MLPPNALPQDAVSAADTIFQIKHTLHECLVRAQSGDPSAYPEAYRIVANLDPDLWSIDAIADAHARIGTPIHGEPPSY